MDVSAVRMIVIRVRIVEGMGNQSYCYWGTRPFRVWWATQRWEEHLALHEVVGLLKRI